MKKNIFLGLVLLLTCGCVNAQDWQVVKSELPNVQLYIDMDSIRMGSTDHDFLYAARYQVAGQTEKLIYLKTDTKTNQLGIVKVEEYATANYRPVATLSNPRAFMKDVRNELFLKPLHDYVIALSMDDVFVKDYNGVYAVYNAKKNNVNGYSENYEKYVNYEQPSFNEITTNNPTAIKDEFITYANSDNTPSDAVKEYLTLACKQINASWYPPQTEKDKRVVINASINKSGKLVSYDLVESSGDSRIDNSAIKALKDAQTYPKIPADGETYSMIFKFVFERTPFGHTVVY